MYNIYVYVICMYFMYIKMEESLSPIKYSYIDNNYYLF